MDYIPYNSVNTYFKQRFGEKVYKLALDGGMTCPNRDGKIDTRGCIFCSEGGSGDFAQHYDPDITSQINNAISFLRSSKYSSSTKPKNSGRIYVAYFQSYTNTYAPVEYLRKIFTQAIDHEDIVALSIATRPDCLDEKVVALLSELNHIKPVFVELGLQTIHESTADYIRRGYKLSVFEYAYRLLKESGLEVIVHMIIGLPGENKNDILETAAYLANHNVDGVKLQLLHVLKNTDLAQDYEKGLFRTLTLEEYCDIVVSIIEILPPSTVIHRITGDGPKNILIAPLWSSNKKVVLNSIMNTFRQRNTFQGKKCGGGKNGC